MSRHGRRVFRRDDGLEVKAPDEWRARSYAVREKYEGLVLDRSLRGKTLRPGFSELAMSFLTSPLKKREPGPPASHASAACSAAFAHRDG